MKQQNCPKVVKIGTKSYKELSGIPREVKKLKFQGKKIIRKIGKNSHSVKKSR